MSECIFVEKYKSAYSNDAKAFLVYRASLPVVTLISTDWLLLPMSISATIALLFEIVTKIPLGTDQAVHF